VAFHLRESGWRGERRCGGDRRTATHLVRRSRDGLGAAGARKTTPFVAVLLLAGLQTIDRSLLEAAAVDGAGSWRRFTDVTLPLLRPALLVAFLFRALDAFRVFDVVYVMTGGGPGTATEPIALLTFTTLLQNLRFGYGAALSMIVFLVAGGLALATMHVFGGEAFVERRR
jgi:ABC-type sugar transport system permease subunit